jgi:hypothetical protein
VWEFFADFSGDLASRVLARVLAAIALVISPELSILQPAILLNLKFSTLNSQP